MPIPLVCLCGHRWSIADEFAECEFLCPECAKPVQAPRVGEVLHHARCPKPTCAVRLSLSVASGARGAECLCPECRTHFELDLRTDRPLPLDKVEVRCGNAECKRRLRLPHDFREKPRRCRYCKASLRTESVQVLVRPEREEEVVGYSLASETNLSYLLTLEQDGRPLTFEQKQAKQRLIAERTNSHPDQCPACQQAWDERLQQCHICLFDLRSGQRWQRATEEPDGESDAMDKLPKYPLLEDIVAGKVVEFVGMVLKSL